MIIELVILCVPAELPDLTVPIYRMVEKEEILMEAKRLPIAVCSTVYPSAKSEGDNKPFFSGLPIRAPPVKFPIMGHEAMVLLIPLARKKLAGCIC